MMTGTLLSIYAVLIVMGAMMVLVGALRRDANMLKVGVAAFVLAAVISAIVAIF